MSRGRKRSRKALVSRLTLLGQMDATQTALFQQRAAAHYGLGITEMKALDILVREGPRTAGQLAAALNLTSGAITGVVDRLERRGMARRSSDAGDRRRVVIEADHERLAQEENAYAPIGAAFAELYAGYTLKELQFLVRHMETSVEITRQETERLAQSHGAQQSDGTGTAIRRSS